jgi:hypothetical protein
MGIFRPEGSHSARAKSAVANQEATIEPLKSKIAQQMESVTARLNEQALQIQKGQQAISKKLITPTKRSKSPSYPITIIWPHRLGVVQLPEPSLHWRRRRLWARASPQPGTR